MVFWDQLRLPMKTETIQGRVRRIRAQMRDRGIDCLILTKAVDVTYVTAFTGHDSWSLVTRNKVYLLSDSRYIEQAQKQCVQTAIVQRHGSIAEAAAMLVRKLKSVEVVGVAHSISVAACRELQKQLRRRVRAVSGIVEKPRSIKDTFEIATIRKAAAFSVLALEKTVPCFKPGLTESELAGILDLEMRRLGCVNAFETIVAFGSNASRPHHQPTMRKLRRNDTILIDFGANYNGYCSDITRCFAVGKPSAVYRRVYDVVERAQAAAIAAARPGVKLAVVDEAARAVIRESGLPVYGHGTGHGIGLEIHEMPSINADAKGTLEVGQIVTIEPGVYVPGKLGVRIEDDILITEGACHIITGKCPHVPLCR